MHTRHCSHTGLGRPVAQRNLTDPAPMLTLSAGEGLLDR
jgi:hypothetical protein